MPTCCIYVSSTEKCVQCVSASRCPDLRLFGWKLARKFNVPGCTECRGSSCFEIDPSMDEMRESLDDLDKFEE